MDMIPAGHYKISQKLSSVGIYHFGLAVGTCWPVLGSLQGFKIHGKDQLAGSVLAVSWGVGTHMVSIGKQVPLPLHHHCMMLVLVLTVWAQLVSRSLPVAAGATVP